MKISKKLINLKNKNFTRYEIYNSSRLYIVLDSLGASIREMKILNKELITFYYDSSFFILIKHTNALVNTIFPISF